MKILTEKQQLKKRSEEAWNSFQVLDREANRMRNKLNRIEDWFFVSETRKRCLRYEIERKESAASLLAEYSHLLREKSESSK